MLSRAANFMILNTGDSKTEKLNDSLNMISRHNYHFSYQARLEIYSMVVSTVKI